MPLTFNTEKGIRQHLTADVVVVDIRTVGQCRPKGLEKSVAAVVHAGAKAKFPDHERTLFIRSCNANGLGATLYRKLPDE